MSFSEQPIGPRWLLIALALILPGLCAGLVGAQSSAVIVSLILNPDTVTGGDSSTATVTLSGAAPSGGALISLSATNVPAVTVPASVTVPPGARTQTFAVTTRSVSEDTAVTITATYNGANRSAVLTVLRPSSPDGPSPAIGVGVGDTVPVAPQLGSPNPPAVSSAAADTVLHEAGGAGVIFGEPEDRVIRRLMDDGALFIADSAGTALLRLTPGSSEILLDSTARDPVDGVGLARLLRVETSRGSVSAVAALRADDTRGIYRLEGRRLTRLGLVPESTSFGSEELAIDETGQIAYVAASASGALTLFQAPPGAVGVPLPLAQVTGNENVVEISSLRSNGAGDLVFLLNYGEKVVRKTKAGLDVVAMADQVVRWSRGSSATGRLYNLLESQPLIGPDGTVVFQGDGEGFVNVYVARPSRPPEPMLPGTSWIAAGFSYDIAADGTVALRVVPTPAIGERLEPILYVVTPTGEGRPVVREPQPQGRPVFGTGGRIFFLATDPAVPPDPEGDTRPGLYRIRLAGGRVVGRSEAVAVFGQSVPGKPGMQLLRVVQEPAVSTQELGFMGQFGDPGPAAAPVTGYFRVPQDGTLTAGSLVAEEGTLLPGANRLAVLRDLSYRADGSLLFGGLQPGAGPLIASVSDATIQAARANSSSRDAGPLRAHSVQATIEPLLAIGQPLDRPDRRLLAVLSAPLALGRDRQLFAARFSQDGGPGGEGLFTLHQNRQVQAVAVTGDPVPGLSGARFAGFADPPSATDSGPVDCTPFTVSAEPGSMGTPSVYASGNEMNVVFKARLERSGATTFGVFQWTGTILSAVGLSNPEPDQDSLKLSADDRPPYLLQRWAAGPSGRAYLMAGPLLGSSRLYERSTAGLRPLVVSGVAPIVGSPQATLTSLLDYVLTGDSSIVIRGKVGEVEGLFRVEATGLRPVARVGDPAPRFADGTELPGRRFNTSIGVRWAFGLMPDSARGTLLFRAFVSEGGSILTRRGLFRLNAQGDLETLMVERVGVAGARNLSVDALADGLDRQSVNGTTVFAAENRGAGWVLFRSRTVRDAAGRTSFTTAAIAQERAVYPGVPTFPAMDPSRVLSLPCGSGPLFSLNDAGGVACLASNGQRWGIYLFPSSQ